jgi:hypothetical protein
MKNSRKVGCRKNLIITVILIDGKRFARRLRTPPGTLLTPAGVDAQLLREADRVEQYFPGLEFRLVPLRDGNFNFIQLPVTAVADAPDATSIESHAEQAS